MNSSDTKNEQAKEQEQEPKSPKQEAHEAQEQLKESFFQFADALKQAAGPLLDATKDAASKVGNATYEAVEQIKVADKDELKRNAKEMAAEGVAAAGKLGADLASKAVDATNKLISEGYKKAKEMGFNPLRRETVDPKTGETIVTEAYVVNEDGTRDYTSPLVEDAPRLRGMKRKIAGMVLIIIGVPMLILPGPGLASIVAGLAMLKGDYER